MKSVIGVDRFDTLCLTGCNLLEEKQAAPNENTREKANVVCLLSVLRQTSYMGGGGEVVLGVTPGILMESQRNEFQPCSLKNRASSWLCREVLRLSVLHTGTNSSWNDSHLAHRENPTCKCVPINDPALGVKG